jgi:ferredoxin
MWYYIGGAIIALWFIGGIYKHFRRRGKVICVIAENCTGCKRCLRKCNHNVLLATIDESGKTRVAVQNSNRCTACGDCISGCKFDALKLILKSKEL